jgi:hypothetical protein
MLHVYSQIHNFHHKKEQYAQCGIHHNQVSSHTNLRHKKNSMTNVTSDPPPPPIIKINSMANVTLLYIQNLHHKKVNKTVKT